MSKKMTFPLKHYGESEVQVVPSEMMFGRASPIQGWLGGLALSTTVSSPGQNCCMSFVAISGTWSTN